MQFTIDNLTAIERTLDRMATAAIALSETREQHQNVLAVQYIIGEVRLCACLMVSDDADTRTAAIERLTSLITHQGA